MKINKFFCLIGAGIIGAIGALGVMGLSADEPAPSKTVRAYVENHRKGILQDLESLVAIPNTAVDGEDLEKNAVHIQKLLTDLDIPAQLLKAKNTKMPPAVFAEWKVSGAKQTLLFYAHYDGVIVKPERWTVTKPFTPVVLNGPADQGGQPIKIEDRNSINPRFRLYARSASDDKAGVMGIVTAIRALKASGQQPSINLKFLFEGEEEAGSMHLPQLLDENRETVKSDGWILVDGPIHFSGRRTILFGVRGDSSVDLTVYGPRRPIHSGHYSGWAPNPALRLSHLISSMEDDRGHVLIKGFYEGTLPLGPLEKKALAEIPKVDDAMKTQMGFAQAINPKESLAQSITKSILTLRGLSSGGVGDSATNVIPASATASLEFRLVKGNDWKDETEKLIRHVKNQGYTVLDHDPTDEERAAHPKIAKIIRNEDGYNAERVSMDDPIALEVVRAMQKGVSEPIVKLPTMGGSLPIQGIHKSTGVPCLVVSIANFDNNQHSDNENLRLGNLFDGIDSIAAIMMLSEQRPKF